MGILVLLVGVGAFALYWVRRPQTTLDQYLSLEKSIRTIAQDQDAPAAVAFLQDAIRKDPNIENFCHPLAHDIGQVTLGRMGFERALRFEYDICGSGYIHGVVEQYMKGIPDFVAELHTLCPPDSRKCFHGIGHGLMLRSENDLPGSLEHCHTFSQTWQQVQCAEGVFMENFEANLPGHSTQYLRVEDPYFPCRNLGAIDEAVCAFYMPRYYVETRGHHYQDLISYCANVPEGPRDACYKGVGDTAMKYRITDPLFAESVCAQVPQDKRRHCIAGMVSYFIVHHASAEKGNELCVLLEKHDLPACAKAVEEGREAYPNES